MERPICPDCEKLMGKNGTRGDTQGWRCSNCGHARWIPIVMTGYETVDSSQVLAYEFKKPVRIHGLTDIHYGANEHHERKFARAVEMIREDPDARWFGNGDLIELIPSPYKINQRGQKIKNEDQIVGITDLLSPIADKCLFIRTGNHERRAINLMDMNITSLIAANLGVPFCDMPGYMTIKVGNKTWKLATGHGFSVAKNGNLELYRMKEVYSDADVFYLGHDHKLYAEPMPSLRVDGDEEKLSNKWFVRGGSFMKYADYARERFYSVGKTGWIEMIFTETEIECVVHS